jgi:hypothetical protein
MTEEEIRKAAIIAVTERIAELQFCGNADTPERLEVLRNLLAKFESSNGGDTGESDND